MSRDAGCKIMQLLELVSGVHCPCLLGPFVLQVPGISLCSALLFLPLLLREALRTVI